MPTEFAYMTNAKNLRAILERIRGAGTPPKFTHDFLKTLGFGSSTDRPAIGVLKQLGFLTSDGVPTDRYNAYRDSSRSGLAMAEGLREGWSPLFLADQSANTRASAQLTELMKSVTGKAEASSQKMATTFRVLCELANWGLPSNPMPAPQSGIPEAAESPVIPEIREQNIRTADFNLHHDVHIHLPSTSDLAVYTAIFRALKAELL